MTADGYPQPFDSYARERYEGEREAIRSGYRTRAEQIRDEYTPDYPDPNPEE